MASGRFYARSKTDSYPAVPSRQDDPTLPSGKSLPAHLQHSTRGDCVTDIVSEITNRFPDRAIDLRLTSSDRWQDDRQSNDLPTGDLGAGHPEAALCEDSLDNSDPTSGARKWPIRSDINGDRPHSESQPIIGGYNPDIFVNELDERYLCRVCLQGLREPVQTSCGHRFCDSCIQELSRKFDSVPPCPIDRKPLTQVFKDNFCKREILGFRVRCSNFANGCRWQGELIDLEKHIKTCSWEVVSCPNSECKEHILRKHLDDHLLDNCKFRRVACEHCKQLVLYNDMKIHVRDNCPDTPKMCPYNCGEVIPRQKLQDHLSKCLEAQSACTFGKIGCPFYGTRREVKAHEDNPTAVAEHLSLACKVISEKTTEMAALKAENGQKNTFLTALAARVEQLESKATRREQQSKSFSLRLQQLEDSVVAPKGTRCSDDALPGRIVSLEKISTSIEKNMTVVQRQLNEIRSDVQKLSQQADTSASLADTHDLRLLGLETASYDGALIWKVNFEKAMADAQSGAKMSIYSPPFYSSRYGFKMCARLYPLGDGIGRSTHLSFFFVVMNGENDAILPWPFRQRVTLTLLDQSPSRRDISETFLPDINSSSFQRPTTGMNVASGCPRFITHDLLQSRRNTYIKDGIMFLKVSVDRTGLIQP